MGKNYQYNFLAGKKNPFLKKYLVYSDGSHYIARSICKKGGRIKKKYTKPECRILFDLLYDQGIKSSLAEKELKGYITAGFVDDYGYSENERLLGYIDENLKRKARNIWQREKRFKRKAYLNRWNYFVTFTYDGAKHTEETFIEKLRKCLCNLHNRRGWRYMGVAERGEEAGRFHYHFLMYIPDGEMVGNLYKRRDYSKKLGTVKETISNDFFEKRFGRNDFEEIIMQVNGSQAVNYCLKYMRKTNSRPIYSRGIPTEVVMELDKDYDFACEMSIEGAANDYVYKRWVIYDSVVCFSSNSYPQAITSRRMLC